MKRSLESQQFTPEQKKAEITKDEIAARVLDKELEVDDRNLRNLPSIMKWTLNINKGKEHWSKEKTESMISGLARGMIAERVNLLVPLDQAETILPDPRIQKMISESSIISTSDESIPALGVNMRTREIVEGRLKGKKPGILQAAVRDTIKVPDVVPEKLRDQYISDVIEGYGGSSPSPEADAGIHYEETTIPDAFIKYHYQIIGAVESKAYSAGEFKLYVDEAKKQRKLHVEVSTERYNEFLGAEEEHWGGGINLGFDVEGEQRMVDILRDSLYGADAMDDYVPILLRVPADVDNQDIEEYYGLCRELGLENMIVQKLPFSSEELDELGVKAIKAVKEEFTKRDHMSLSNRELKVLGEYADIDFESEPS